MAYPCLVKKGLGVQTVQVAYTKQNGQFSELAGIFVPTEAVYDVEEALRLQYINKLKSREATMDINSNTSGCNSKSHSSGSSSDSDSSSSDSSSRDSDMDEDDN